MRLTRRSARREPRTPRTGRIRQVRLASCDDSDCLSSKQLYTIRRLQLSLSPLYRLHDTMQSTRAFNMLRQRAMPAFRAQPTRGLRLQASPKMRMPVPVSVRKRQWLETMLTISQKEEHSGM